MRSVSSSTTSTASTDVDIEFGVGSWLGLVATVHLLEMDPMNVFAVKTYFDPVFLATWVMSTIVIGLLLTGVIIVTAAIFTICLEIIAR